MQQPLISALLYVLFTSATALASDATRDNEDIVAALDGTNNQKKGDKKAAASPMPTPTPFIQLQTWFTAYDMDEDPQADPGGYGDPEHDIGFSMPRARLGLYGSWGFVDYSLTLGTSRPYDAVSPDVPVVDLIDAYATANIPNILGKFQGTVGLTRVPFSREMMMSSAQLVFQERAVSTNWLAPNRDIGITGVQQIQKYVTVSAGVYNGNGNRLGDDDPGVMVAGRAEVHMGDSYRTNRADSAAGLGLSVIYNDRLATDTLGLNADLLARFRGLSLQVEANRTQITPGDDSTILAPEVPAQTIRWGGFAQLAYFVKTPVGGIEPAVRFAIFDDATHLDDNGDVGALHAGVTWREPLPTIDIGVGYIWRTEFSGRTIANDTVRMWFQFKYPPRRKARPS
jgi:hypothetical protein